MSATAKTTHMLPSERIKGVDMHPQKPWVAASTFKGTVAIYNYRTGMRLKEIRVSQEPVRCVRFVPGHPWVICGSDDRMIRCYDYNTQARIASFKAHEDFIRGLWVFEDNGDLILASSGDDCVVRLWAVCSQSIWPLLGTYGGHVQMILSVCAVRSANGVSTGAHKIISAGYDGRICVHETIPYVSNQQSQAQQQQQQQQSNGARIIAGISVGPRISSLLTSAGLIGTTVKKLTNKGAKKPNKVMGVGISSGQGPQVSLSGSLTNLATSISNSLSGNVAGAQEETKRGLNVVRPINAVTSAGQLIPKGTKILTGGDDTRVIVWDVSATASQGPICSLCSHVDNITDVCGLVFTGENGVVVTDADLEQDPTESYYAYLNNSNDMKINRNKKALKTVIISCSEDGTVVGNLLDQGVMNENGVVDEDANTEDSDILFKSELGLGRCWCMGVIGDNATAAMNRQKYGQITICVGCDRGLAIIRVKIRGKQVVSQASASSSSSSSSSSSDSQGVDTGAYMGEAPHIVLNRMNRRTKGTSACKCLVIGSVDDECDTVFIGNATIYGNGAHTGSNESEGESAENANNSVMKNTLLLDKINSTFVVPGVLLMNSATETSGETGGGRRGDFRPIYTTTNRDGEKLRIEGGLIKGAHFGGNKYILIEEKLGKKYINDDVQPIGLSIISALSYKSKCFISEHNMNSPGRGPQPILCATLVGEYLVYITRAIVNEKYQYMMYFLNVLSNGSTEIISANKISSHEGDIPITMKFIRTSTFTGLAVFFSIAENTATSLRLYTIAEDFSAIKEVMCGSSSALTLTGNICDMSVYEEESDDDDDDDDDDENNETTTMLLVWSKHYIHTIAINGSTGAKLTLAYQLPKGYGKVDSVSMIPIESTDGKEKTLIPVFSTSNGKIQALMKTDNSNMEIIPIASCCARGVLVYNNDISDEDKLKQDAEKLEENNNDKVGNASSTTPAQKDDVIDDNSTYDEKPSDVILSDALYHPEKYKESNVILSEENLSGGAGLLLAAACLASVE